MSSLSKTAWPILHAVFYANTKTIEFPHRFFTFSLKIRSSIANFTYICKN